MQALSQLSYSPTGGSARYGTRPPPVNLAGRQCYALLASANGVADDIRQALSMPAEVYARIEK